MAEVNKTFSDPLGVVGGFGFIQYNTDPFGKSFNGLINAQSDLSKRSSIGVEARITVYGLIGDKGLVKGGFAGAFLHFRDSNPFTMHED